METIILDFINEFKSSHSKEIEDLFMNGYCYYFAIILKERFDSIGTIMYIPIYNHFCYMINKSLYDITGKITDEEKINLAEPWDKYKDNDYLESYRIIKDCIMKNSASLSVEV